MGYSRINQYLYDSNFQPSNSLELENLKKDIDILTDCIDNKELPMQAKLYRGISDITHIFGKNSKNMTPDEIIKNYTGAEYVNPAFTSTSFDESIAMNFMDEEKYSGLLTIKAPKGTRAMCVGDVSVYNNQEGEVLLQRGTIYKINKINYKNGKYNITMTAKGLVR